MDLPTASSAIFSLRWHLGQVTGTLMHGLRLWLEKSRAMSPADWLAPI